MGPKVIGVIDNIICIFFLKNPTKDICFSLKLNFRHKIIPVSYLYYTQVSFLNSFFLFKKKWNSKIKMFIKNGWIYVDLLLIKKN